MRPHGQLKRNGKMPSDHRRSTHEPAQYRVRQTSFERSRRQVLFFGGVVFQVDQWYERLRLLGFDHEKFTYRYAGRDFRLTDVHGTIVKELIA